MDDAERFDIENVRYDDDGTPIIPRISYSVPKAYRKEFLQDMIDEVRNSPGEQLMAIVVKYYRMKRAEVLKAGLPSEQRRIPAYGPKPTTSASDQGRPRTAGEE